MLTLITLLKNKWELLTCSQSCDVIKKAKRLDSCGVQFDRLLYTVYDMLVMANEHY